MVNVKYVVMGIGSILFVFLVFEEKFNEYILYSSGYLYKKEEI